MWEAIRANKRRSAMLITVVAMILLGLGCVIGLYVGPMLEAAQSFQAQAQHQPRWESGAVDLQAGLVGATIALAVLVVLWIVAATSGDDILLSSANAREIQKKDAARLFDIVEEMTLAAGLPKMPRVFIIDTDAPNAFSVGTPENSVVAATSGLLMHLNRDELQGVIGHEIGHIKNQDTRFMTLAAIMLGAIILIADVFGQVVFYSGRGQRRSSSRDSGGAQVVILLVALVFVILAPIVAQLFYFACSRRREYLADATSARFTRYPEGLASALEKIERTAGQMSSVNRATAPMYVINPLQAANGSFSLFSTHPPTADRIRLLRSMAGAGFAAYEKAYASAFGQGLIGPVTLSQATDAPVRAPSAEAEKEPLAKAREAVDAIHRTNGLLFVQCPCGVKLKAPPIYAGGTITCPRCGTENAVPSAPAAAG